LTKYGIASRLKGMELGRRLRCSITYQDNAKIKARVKHTNALVGVDCEVNWITKTIKCPCNSFEEMKIPCPHAWCIIITHDLSPNDPAWLDKRYHVQNMLTMYEMQPPDLSLLGKLEVGDLIPPEHKKTSGRPKKRKDRGDFLSRGIVTKQYSCHACGQLTHGQKTCPKPCTMYRFRRFAAEAKKWAQKQIDIGPDDYVYNNNTV